MKTLSKSTRINDNIHVCTVQMYVEHKIRYTSTSVYYYDYVLSCRVIMLLLCCFMAHTYMYTLHMCSYMTVLFSLKIFISSQTQKQWLTNKHGQITRTNVHVQCTCIQMHVHVYMIIIISNFALTKFSGSTAYKLLRDRVKGDTLNRVRVSVFESSIRRVTGPNDHYMCLVSPSRGKVQTYMNTRNALCSQQSSNLERIKRWE